MKLTRLAIALALVPMLSQADVTVSAFGTYRFFDAQTVERLSRPRAENVVDLKGHEGYAVSVGYRFTPNWAVEGHFGRTETWAAYSENFTTNNPYGKVRADRTSVDGIYTFSPDAMIAPYVLAGVGQSRISQVDAGSLRTFTNNGVSKDTIIDLGAGALVNFNRYVALRAEVRNVHNADESLNDQIAMLGLQLSTGGASKPAPVQAAPAPAPAPTIIEKVAAVVAPVAAAVMPAPVPAPAPAPVDSDKDGVVDSADKCADTATDIIVDATGCPKVLTEAINEKVNVTFDSGKSVVKDADKAEVAKLAALLKGYPTAVAEVQGYTDSKGNKAKNQKLSQARADAIKNSLVKDFGIDAGRVTAKGYGSANPVADNKTAEGQAQNRRIVAVVTGEKKVEAKKAKKK